MVNQDFVSRLVNLIKQSLITVDDIKIQDYKDAVQIQLNAQLTHYAKQSFLGCMISN